MQSKEGRISRVKRHPAGQVGTPARSENLDPPSRLGGIAVGTRLLTPDGYRPIETLRPGSSLRAVLGQGPTFVPILWIGRRSVILPRSGWSHLPVRMRKHAIANEVPVRDVLLAPDHGIYLESKLYLSGDLVSGGSILLDRHSRSMQYWGVLLARHNILLADNLPIESLLPISAAAFTDVTGQPPNLAELFLTVERERIDDVPRQQRGHWRSYADIRPR